MTVALRVVVHVATRDRLMVVGKSSDGWAGNVCGVGFRPIILLNLLIDSHITRYSAQTMLWRVPFGRLDGPVRGLASDQVDELKISYWLQL